MSENVEKINWGWLNDFNGYKFAPITVIEKIYNEQGQPFIAQFNSLKTDYDALLTGDKIIKEAVSASNLINNGIPYDVGNEGNPVYFEDGVPKACTELTNNKISTNEFECGGLSSVDSLLVRTDATIGKSLRINPNDNNTSPGLVVNYIRGEKLKKDGTVAQEGETEETERIIKLHGNLSLEPHESMIKFYHLLNEDNPEQGQYSSFEFSKEQITMHDKDEEGKTKETGYIKHDGTIKGNQFFLEDRTPTVDSNDLKNYNIAAFDDNGRLYSCTRDQLDIAPKLDNIHENILLYHPDFDENSTWVERNIQFFGKLIDDEEPTKVGVIKHLFGRGDDDSLKESILRFIVKNPYAMENEPQDDECPCLYIEYGMPTDTADTRRAGVRNARFYGAVWNDYAEFRNQIVQIEPGYCVASLDDGKVYKTNEKLQACDGIVSDTFGFSIGESETCRTPIAVAGRVLAYCEGDRNDYHAGDTVCASANGKVCKMTREEICEYPDRIVGVVSEVPQYEIWDNGIEVKGRIWVKVK